MKPLTQLSSLMRQQQELIEKFNGLSPGRHFTADGHLIGSIGEMIASHEHGLTLAPASTRGWDATRVVGAVANAAFR